MIFQNPLVPAVFLKRYKRFFADVVIHGQLTVAHVPNTGSLKSCLSEGAPCLVSESQDPKRKLKATLHFIQTPTGWVGVDTSLPNRLAVEAWQEKRLWTEWTCLKPEFKISKETRLDLAFSHTEDQPRHFVEIKNVTYRDDQAKARFPDAVTERGTKHLRELMDLTRKGYSTETLFVVQRQDCQEFSPADEIDPVYAKALREAAQQGVRIRALTTEINTQLQFVQLGCRELLLSL